MSFKIIEECQKACITKKIDNKKTRRALERGNIILVNEVMNDYNSKNIPKNRRNERFKIRDRLNKKLFERDLRGRCQLDIDPKIDYQSEIPEIDYQPEIDYRPKIYYV